MASESWADRCTLLATASGSDELRVLLLAQASAIARVLDPDRARHREWSRLGIQVKPKQMSSAGAGIDMGSHRVIYVRADDKFPRQRFTVAHEVAHLLLTGVHAAGRVILSRTAEERLCDDFAAALLIPQAQLTAAMPDMTWENPDELLSLCRSFGVGIHAMVIALARLWPHPDRVLLVSQKMGHPRRPTEVAVRVLANAAATPIFIPRDQRLISLGLLTLAGWADAAMTESRATGEDAATFKTWTRVRQRSSSGSYHTTACWNAHRLNNGIILAMLRLTNAVPGNCLRLSS